jgi:hypothetical protein
LSTDFSLDALKLLALRRVLLKVFIRFLLGSSQVWTSETLIRHTERKANISLEALKNIMEGRSFLLESSQIWTSENLIRHTESTANISLEALKNIMKGLAEGLHSLLVGVLASLNSRDSYYTYREKSKHFSGGPEEHYGGS